jgi:hypothetical protein
MTFRLTFSAIARDPLPAGFRQAMETRMFLGLRQITDQQFTPQSLDLLVKCLSEHSVQLRFAHVYSDVAEHEWRTTTGIIGAVLGPDDDDVLEVLNKPEDFEHWLGPPCKGHVARARVLDVNRSMKSDIASAGSNCIFSRKAISLLGHTSGDCYPVSIRGRIDERQVRFFPRFSERLVHLASLFAPRPCAACGHPYVTELGTWVAECASAIPDVCRQESLTIRHSEHPIVVSLDVAILMLDHSARLSLTPIFLQESDIGGFLVAANSELRPFVSH